MKTRKIVWMATLGIAGLIGGYAWVGSGVFDGFFSPSVEEGALGAGTSNLVQKLLEIGATIATALAAGKAVDWLKIIDYVSDAFETSSNTPEQPEGSTMPSGMFEDCSRLLIQSAIDGDKDMTVLMAERINGSAYLTQEQSQQ